MADEITSEIGKQEYKKGKPQATQNRPHSPVRRRLLQGAAAVGVVTLATGAGLMGKEAGLYQMELQGKLDRKKFEKMADSTEEIITGPVRISKKGDSRGQPYISPNGIMSNARGWDDVEKVNGEYIKDTNGFTIENPILVKGDNEDGPGQGRWIPILVTRNSLGASIEELRYLPQSGHAEKEGIVVMDRGNGARFKEVEKREGDLFVFKDGTKINKADLNKVIVPQATV